MLDLGGNVRKNAKLSGTTHNVFGIQIGVAIALLVKTGKSERRIEYARTDEFSTRQQKYDFLEEANQASGIKRRTLRADQKHNWLLSDSANTYAGFLPTGDKAAKRDGSISNTTIFQLFSLGVVSSRDAYVYNFDRSTLQNTAQIFIDVYGQALAVLRQNKVDPDTLIDVTDARIKWTRQTKASLNRGNESKFKPDAIRDALYRPFTRTAIYFDDFWNEEQYRFREIFPSSKTEKENTVLCATGPGAERPFACLARQTIPDLNFFGPGTVPQWFPFYIYAPDGSHRRENITDWALEQFRAHYADPSITKWDIFHYVYAVLHHPDYRERYAANLRRELPRIPFATASGCHPEQSEGPMQSAGATGAANHSIDPSARKERGPQDDKPKNSSVTSVRPVVKDFEVFNKLAKAGQGLAEIHLHCEQQPEYKLTKVEKAGEKLDYRVTKMRLSKDKASLIYNQFLTLTGIPPETYEYRLGNRSALEWIVDQYQVSTDKRSGITNDPNRADDPTYILRLIGQVITVSLETVRIVKSLPELGISQISTAPV